MVLSFWIAGRTLVANDVINHSLTDLDALDYNFTEFATGGQLTSGATEGWILAEQARSGSDYHRRYCPRELVDAEFR